jgi:hypothetical protein
LASLAARTGVEVGLTRALCLTARLFGVLHDGKDRVHLAMIEGEVAAHGVDAELGTRHSRARLHLLERVGPRRRRASDSAQREDPCDDEERLELRNARGRDRRPHSDTSAAVTAIDS